jgi:radical SAM family uncharacterized protein/radical SAM-linked protein
VNLSLYQKPSRYINKEINSIYKDAPVRVALAFPDVYEIGMSHLGLKILYKIINDIPYASAERVFAPWKDLEFQMREKNIPLCTLESNRPLIDFDIVGFSLQYELSYTTVLSMLKLGGIPYKSEERKIPPLIIAGGPCTVNPLPISPYFDAILIGDGEISIEKIIQTYYLWKNEGDSKRYSLLHELSKIDGMYVPSIHGESSKIKRFFIKSLDNVPYPDKPIVPYMSIIHDRLNIEVSRGCSMGCRFCQAGIIYRPVRERSPENVLSIVGKSLKNTGFEEVAFTSLSAGDYTYLLYVIKNFNRLYREKKIAISLPSLRVSSINKELLQEIKSVRKTGFTIAPEAGTDRLRRVINKDFSHEDYERAVDTLFKEGWQNLKLYFMIGLPTETQEDIEAIYNTSLIALKTAKRYIRGFVNISIGISPFIPKPHTPFQWLGQEDTEELKRKKEYLKKKLNRKNFSIREHNINMSLLEAALSRGDKNISSLIENAWKIGCYLDSWSDIFDFNKWQNAMDITGIDIHRYARKAYDISETLPWDIIETGVNKEFLKKEFKKALQGETSIDCRKLCHNCGIYCNNIHKEETKPKQIENNYQIDFNIKASNKSLTYNNTAIVRSEFYTSGILKYLSHLELIKLILRAIRRAEIPVDYTRGFHPRPKVSFGPPLNVGIEGLNEYFDMVIFLPFDLLENTNKLNRTLPEGIKIKKMSYISPQEPSLNKFIKKYEYEIKIKDEELNRLIQEKVISLKKGSLINKKEDFLEDIEYIGDSCYKLTLIDKDNKKIKLSDVINTLFSSRLEELDIKRIALFGWDNGWKKPL